MRGLISLLAILALVACAPSTRLTLLDPTRRPPKASSELVVYRDVPERSHSVIALWEAEDEALFGRDRLALEKSVIARAAALGADAVILSIKEQGGMPYRMPLVVPGVAQEAGEVTIFSDVTKIHARFIIWR